jgi:hypothetical protein
MESIDNINNKKKLMYVKGEDYYYFTYNLLVLLDVLGCDNADRKFIDYKKMAFLVDFVADKSLIDIYSSHLLKGNNINLNDKELYVRTYSEGLIRINQIMRLIVFLEKKGILSLERVSKRNVIHLWLNRENLPDDFFDKKLFAMEYENANFLKKAFRGLRSISLNLMTTRLFSDYVDKKWQI